MKVKDIYRFLNERFPFESALDFDNCGLLIGSEEAEVKCAVAALDCTSEVLEFAIEKKAELIITHHPVIFEGVKSVTDETLIYKAVKNGISVICAHTNLDTSDGGVNDALCAVLGLENIEKIVCADGYTFRKGVLPKPMTADELAHYAKERLLFGVRFVDGGKQIRTLAVSSGSGSSMYEDAFNSGADAFLSSEIKHNVFLTAKSDGFAVLDAGHEATERIVVEPLTALLKASLHDVNFISYTNENIRSI